MPATAAAVMMGRVCRQLGAWSSPRSWLMKASLSLLLVCCITGFAGAADRFEEAAARAKRSENLLFRDRVKPTWLAGDRSFWYRVQTGPRSQEFVLIDAVSGERRVAADLAALDLPQPDDVKT